MPHAQFASELAFPLSAMDSQAMNLGSKLVALSKNSLRAHCLTVVTLFVAIVSLLQETVGFSGQTEMENNMITLGVILLIVGLLVSDLAILITIGAVLIVVGLILNLVPIGGSRRRVF